MKFPGSSLNREFHCTRTGALLEQAIGTGELPARRGTRHRRLKAERSHRVHRLQATGSPSVGAAGRKRPGWTGCRHGLWLEDAAIKIGPALPGSQGPRGWGIVVRSRQVPPDTSLQAIRSQHEGATQDSDSNHRAASPPPTATPPHWQRLP